MLKKYVYDILDVLHDGICITDSKGKILYLNSQYSKISSLPREKMIGMNVNDLINQGFFDIALNNDIVNIKMPVTRIQSTGNGRHLILDGYPILNKNGDIELCVTFVRDDDCINNFHIQLSQHKKLLSTFHKITKNNTDEDNFEIISSTIMKELYAKISHIADTDIPILILGETGVGKDIMARRIHELSSRCNSQFIKIDCGSLVHSLMESELFGYESGSFSGANKKGKTGLIEAADGGTLFLDEIGELSLGMQTKLLRFLQDNEIVRIGSSVPKKINTRLIAATNRELYQAVLKKEFRQDLYYRLKYVVIKIPPLRERKKAIPSLAHTFLMYYNKKYNKALKFTKNAINALTIYSWPGNIRELKNTIQSLCITIRRDVIDDTDLPFYPDFTKYYKTSNSSVRQKTYRELMDKYESEIIDKALKTYGSVAEAAKKLELDRSTLFRKIKQLKIQKK